MDPNEYEIGVLAGLISNPSLIVSTVVLPDYFPTPSYRHLCEFLNSRAGDFSDWHEIKPYFDAKYPHNLTNEDWDYIADAYLGVGVFNSYLTVLRQHYNKLQAQTSADIYSNDPSDDNLDDLKISIANLDEPSAIKAETAEDMQNGLEYELTHDLPDGIKTYASLDDALNGGLRGGNLFVIGARPAVGKSAFSLNILLEAAKNNLGFKGDLFSLEMRNVENRNRMLAHETGIQVGKFHNAKNKLDSAQKQKTRDAMREFTKMGIQFYDTCRTPEEIINQIRSRALSTKRGHYLAVVDYLQLLHTSRRIDNRVQEIGEITRAFKVLTNELDIPIILLSQLNRASLQKQEDTLADLRESGSIEQDANVVAFLSNVDDQANTQDRQRVALNFKKNREGRLANLSFNFFKDVQKFVQTF